MTDPDDPINRPDHRDDQMTRFETSLMRVLALDTSTRAGGVALVEDDRLVDERRGDPERTPRRAAAAARFSRCSTASVSPRPTSTCSPSPPVPARSRACASASRRCRDSPSCIAGQIAAVSALEALAHLASSDVTVGSLVGAWMDAQRRDVFSALYRVAPFPLFDPRRLIEIDPPQVVAPALTLTRWRHVARGRTRRLHRRRRDGVRRHDWRRPIRTPASCRIPRWPAPSDESAWSHATSGLAMDPGAVRPLYVRRPDAEVERDRRRATR